MIYQYQPKLTKNGDKKLKRVVILFSGTGSNMQKIIENLATKIEIVECISDNENAKGIEIAKKFNIKIHILKFKKRDELNEELIEHLKDKNIDLVICAGFMRILSANFVNKFNAINIHPSLLPRHKGMNAIEKSFEDEFSDAGITIHHINEELDGGKIILQAKINKIKGESVDDFKNRIHKLEHENYSQVIENLLLKD